MAWFFQAQRQDVTHIGVEVTARCTLLAPARSVGSDRAGDTFYSQYPHAPRDA